MATHWLWDTRGLSKEKVKKILLDEKDPRFLIYAERLLSRTFDPAMVLTLINKKTLCEKWPAIKKRMQKDRWRSDQVLFWQTIYERLHEKLISQGIKIRHPAIFPVPPEGRQLADQIRRIRKRLGYTQKDVAKKLGVIQQYVSQLESGCENVSLSTLKRIADAFDRRLVVRLV